MEKQTETNSIKNPEGYIDETPYKAIKTLEAEEYKAYKTFETMLHVARLAGFHVEGEVILSTKEGRTYNAWELKEQHKRAKQAAKGEDA